MIVNPVVITTKHLGGFQLEFLGISRIINLMTSYDLSALIGVKLFSSPV